MIHAQRSKMLWTVKSTLICPFQVQPHEAEQEKMKHARSSFLQKEFHSGNQTPSTTSHLNIYVTFVVKLMLYFIKLHFADFQHLSNPTLRRTTDSKQCNVNFFF